MTDTKVRVLPGDRLATIEEFVPGSNSTVSLDSIISTKIGFAEKDMKNRVVKVTPARETRLMLPEAGDIVIGSVESAQGSVAQVKIEAINDIGSSKGFTGMLSLREESGGRRSGPSMPTKAGDVIRAKVFSTRNAIYHLTLDCPECGVVYTVCSNCGGSVVALGRDRVKCRDCGWVDDRILSEDFVRLSRVPTSE